MKFIKIKKRYLIFREEAKKIFKPLTKRLKPEPIYLDFSEVKFISRSFTDELLNFLSWLKARKAKVNVRIFNLKPNLKKMVKLVKKSKERTKRELTFICL